MVSNRLINEKSPYLLQHAHNPVDWYAWSDEAFERAHSDNKPVFLSIGYATCHWCHVMEKESFEDPETAKALNDTFVCIKVDREERPDIDAVYMAACHMIVGRGGWPLTIVMTPDKKPFFAATYLPKTGGFGRPGVIDLCRHVKSVWRDEREKVLASASNITGALGNAFAFSPEPDLDRATPDRAYAHIEQGFDRRWGGFDAAPKFPTPHKLLFLLRHHQSTGIPDALEMVTSTLTAMRLGGIWDHVGFGFHRYATDARWLLPHFEKMLYDQALIAQVYLETYQITRDPFFAQTAEEIFTYILRDMTDPAGGFYAAEDADSEGEEGKFYVWSLKEFQKIMADEDASLWERIFDVKSEGNFSDEATGRRSGANILHLEKPLPQWAGELGIDATELKQQWENIRTDLFRVRKARIHPLKDDKILTDWNGLMISALALGARILDAPQYARAAQRAADFILKNMTDGSGGLFHRCRDGDVAIRATANDYAFFTWGLLDLYAATRNPAYADQAVAFQERMIEYFWDSDGGGFFLTAADDTQLPVRPKELYDGALPSANSVALVNLMRLSRITENHEWEKRAREHALAFAGTVNSQPSAFTHFLMGMDRVLKQTPEG